MRGRFYSDMTKHFLQNNLHLWLSLAISGLVLLFLLLLFSIEKHNRANDQYHQSLLLSDALRQSSDDLTRMVRTYIVTRDSRYKTQFYEILRIRDGKSPRPLFLNRIYWDLVSEDDERPMPYGESISLLKLMEQSCGLCACPA